MLVLCQSITVLSFPSGNAVPAKPSYDAGMFYKISKQWTPSGCFWSEIGATGVRDEQGLAHFSGVRLWTR